MANTTTTIQLKYSDVTSVPPSLNISEPAYSNVSNKLWINDGDHIVAIGGKYYTDLIDASTAENTSNTVIKRDLVGDINVSTIRTQSVLSNGINVLDKTNSAFDLANTLSQNSFTSVYSHANSAYLHANAAYNKANTPAGANGELQFNLNGGYGSSANLTYDSGSNTLYVDTINATTNVDAQNIIAYNKFYAGIATVSSTPLPNLIAQFTGNTDSYVQVNIQNIDPEGSSDYVVTADVGNDETFFVDLGMQGSQLEQGTLYPLDGYLLVQGNTSQLGGNLVIGTISDTPGIKTRIVSGGYDTANIVAEFSEEIIEFIPEISSPTTVRISEHANSSFGFQNLTSLHSNSAYNQANTGTQYATSAGSYANSAYNQANTGTQYATSAGSYANSAYRSQNTTGVYANSAYNQANTGTQYALSAGSYANSAYNQANTGTQYATSAGSYANSAYRSQNTTGVYANTAYLHANAAYVSQNTTGSYANSAYLHANAAYVSQNTTGVYANTAYLHANSAYVSQNATGSYANSAYTHANASYVSQNTTGSYANSSYLHANSAYVSQNTTGVYANAAFDLANTKFNSSGGSISGDVNITGNLSVSGDLTYINVSTLLVGDNNIVLNSDIPSTQAPTENAGIEVSRGSSLNVQILWNETTDKWSFTNDGFSYHNIGSSASESYANSAYLHANSSYISQNTTGQYANSAYLHANSAYVSQNTTGSYANSAYLHANASYVSQNTTGSYANSAYLHANAAYLSQNSSGQYANSAYLHANSAYVSQNTTGSYANSAYLHANAAYIKANTAAGSDGQIQLNVSGAFGASANLKFSNTTNTLTTNNVTAIANVGYANTAGSVKVYQYYNEASGSLDTVFL